MPKILIDGHVEPYFDESGAGRPIVFVHGVWMSGRYFYKQVPALGENHHAIALDLRGHGQSSHAENGHTMVGYERDLHAFLAAKGLKDVVLAGWSMSCMVIWDYFKLSGNENVAAAILIDQSPSDFKWMVAECMRMPASIASAGLFSQTMQDYRADLAKVTGPTLAIAGAMANKMLPTESVKYVHENISN